jgi:hypothetical protein
MLCGSERFKFFGGTYLLHRINGFLDFVHHLDSEEQKTKPRQWHVNLKDECDMFF